MRLLLTAVVVASLSTFSTPTLAQEAQCISHFSARGGVKGRFPGSIVAEANRPCQFPIYVNGGRNMILKVLKQPNNGSLQPEGLSVLHYAPKAGFTGKDFSVVLFGNRKNKARIRFAIDVR